MKPAPGDLVSSTAGAVYTEPGMHTLTGQMIRIADGQLGIMAGSQKAEGKSKHYKCWIVFPTAMGWIWEDLCSVMERAND